MEETKHTPGPWKVYQNCQPLHPTAFSIKNDKGLLVAYLNIGMSDVEANAELIAKAPELLEQVAALTAEVERLKEENERLKQELKDEIQYRKEQVAEVQRDAYKEIDKYRR